MDLIVVAKPAYQIIQCQVSFIKLKCDQKSHLVRSLKESIKTRYFWNESKIMWELTTKNFFQYLAKNKQKSKISKLNIFKRTPP